MKFMLMMNTPRGTGDYEIFKWTPEAFNAHIQFMKDLNRDLSKSGEFVEAQGLTPPGQAKIVRYAGGGAPVVSDGPFAETKEFLAGYWIIQVEKRERAYEIAARASSAPGPDGKPLVIPIEVREVMSVPLPSEG
jgi:hypothetical protein